MRNRNELGKFTNKSESYRKTRSIRTTDQVWDKFGDMANQINATRADLLEKIISDDLIISKIDNKKILLEEALNLASKLRSNSGKIIKQKILEYLEKEK